MNERETIQTIRRILDRHAHLNVEARLVRTHDDLFAKGMTGLAAVDVLLAVEAAFGLMFQPQMVSPRSVASIDALLACLRQLQARPLAA